MTHPDFSDEQLIGFLLGALGNEELEQIARRMMVDPSLAERMVDLRDQIAMFDFPASMAAGRHGDEHSSFVLGGESEGVFDPGEGQNEDVVSPRSTHFPPTDASTSDLENGQAVPESSLLARTLGLVANAKRGGGLAGGLSAVEAIDRGNAGGRGNWYDLLAVCAVLFVLVSLLFPGVLGSNEQARRVHCADNLRCVGTAFAGYSDRDACGRIPSIPIDGRLAFAGYYAIALNDSGFIDDVAVFQCPEFETDRIKRLPTAREIQRMPERPFAFWRTVAGGNYAYHLGAIEDGGYVPVSLSSGRRIAMVADLPIPVRDAQRLVGAATGQATRRWQIHQAEGMNVLFSDGSVQFMVIERENSDAIELFTNRLGLQAAGVDRDDCVLGPSYCAPLDQSLRSWFLRVIAD